MSDCNEQNNSSVPLCYFTSIVYEVVRFIEKYESFIRNRYYSLQFLILKFSTLLRIYLEKLVLNLYLQ